MEKEQWEEHRFLCGLSDFETRERRRYRRRKIMCTKYGGRASLSVQEQYNKQIWKSQNYFRHNKPFNLAIMQTDTKFRPAHLHRKWKGTAALHWRFPNHLYFRYLDPQEFVHLVQNNNLKSETEDFNFETKDLVSAARDYKKYILKEDLQIIRERHGLTDSTTASYSGSNTDPDTDCPQDFPCFPQLLESSTAKVLK